MKHPFFKNHGPFKIEELLKNLKLDNKENLSDYIVHDVKDLQTADKEHITFFHQKNIIYKHLKQMHLFV